MNHSRTLKLISSVSLFCLLLAGCPADDSRPVAEFTGQVSFDGQPMGEGSIHFTSPKTGEGFNANIGEDGKYTVKVGFADVGEVYEVVVSETLVNPPGTPMNQLKVPPKLSVKLPNRYRARPTSGLKAKLEKAGTNTANFELTSK